MVFPNRKRFQQTRNLLPTDQTVETMRNRNLPAQKKKLSVMAGVILILLILIGDFAAGFIGLAGKIPSVPDQPNELSQIQSGNATVTVTSGTSSGTTTVSYSPAYASQPRMWVKATSIMLGPILTARVPDVFASFMSGPTVIWTSMPVATGEVFGDANGEHRIQMTFNAPTIQQSFKIGVRCVAPSNTLGAFLTVQYLSGGSWIELNSAARALVDGTTLSCPGTATVDAEVGPCASLPTLSGATVLRVAGGGGGGLGDNPSFSQLWIDLFPAVSCNLGQTLVTNILGQSRACTDAGLAHCADPQDTSKTGFIIQVFFPTNLLATTSFKFTWSAGVVI